MQVLIQIEATAAGKCWLLIWSLPVRLRTAVHHNYFKSLTVSMYSQCQALIKYMEYAQLEIDLFLEMTPAETINTAFY